MEMFGVSQSRPKAFHFVFLFTRALPKHSRNSGLSKPETEEDGVGAGNKMPDQTNLLLTLDGPVFGQFQTTLDASG